MGVERPKLYCPGCLQNALRAGGIRGSAPLAEVPFGVEASSPFEDQGIRLAHARTAPEDEVPTAAHGPELSCGMPVVRKGCEGLLALVL